MARRGYTYNDRQRTAPNKGAATAAVIVPLALIAGGILLWKRSTQVVEVGPTGHAANALPGMSGFGSKLKKAVKKAAKVATKVDPVAATVHEVKKVVDDPKRFITKPVNLLSKLPGASKSPLVRKLKPRGSPQSTVQPEPGQPIVYQDVNGATITEGEYNAILNAMAAGSPVQFGDRWAMPAGYMITAAQYAAQFPGTSGSQATTSAGGPSSGTSFTSIYTPEGSAPNDPSYNAPSSGGGASYDLGPEAPAVQQYAPASADMPAAAPADKKFNPLLAVGALIAVPVVMGLTGGK